METGKEEIMSGKQSKRIRQSMFNDGLNPKKFTKEYRARKRAARLSPLKENREFALGDNA